MRAAALIAATLLIAGLATTALAYPTTADRSADAPRAKGAAETLQTPQPATQIRVILPAPWESSVQAAR